MVERRAAPRARTLKGAKILFNNRRSVIDCLVRNLSTTGAKLVVETALGIPDEFILLIEPHGVEQTCRVVRREQSALGITFQLEQKTT